MAHQEMQRTHLGEMIAKRLEQLGMSRREFSRRFQISRPTLHDLEFNHSKQFASSTFEAVDEGMKWQAGTAYAFHIGEQPPFEMSNEERIEAYLEQILARILTMDLDELEREVLMLEEEMFGRAIRTDEASTEVIRVTVSRLLVAMLSNGEDAPDAIKATKRGDS